MKPTTKQLSFNTQKGMMVYATKWMNFKNILLSERSQTQNKSHMILLT